MRKKRKSIEGMRKKKGGAGYPRQSEHTKIQTRNFYEMLKTV